MLYHIRSQRMISANRRLQTTRLPFHRLYKRGRSRLCAERISKRAWSSLPSQQMFFFVFFSAPVGMKQSISGHSFRRRDGRTPAGSEPQWGKKKKAIDRQRAEAVKILFPSGRGGLWGGEEGLPNQIPAHQDSPRGAKQSRNDMKSRAKNKKRTYTEIIQTQHTQSFLFCISQRCKTDTWAMSSFFSLPPLTHTQITHPHTHAHTRTHTHTLRNAQRSGDIKFSTYSRHASVRNHITSATPIRNKHNAAARSTLSNLWERHYSSSELRCARSGKKKQSKKHPSIHPERSAGYHFQFFFSLIWDGNELVLKEWRRWRKERSHKGARRGRDGVRYTIISERRIGPRGDGGSGTIGRSGHSFGVTFIRCAL